jgi:PKD repeat protein
MRNLFRFALLVLSLALGGPALGQTDIAPTTPDAAASGLGFSVANFHTMSLYYAPASAPANGKIWMRYRKASETNAQWQEGFPLWYDPRTTDGLNRTTDTLPFKVGSQAYPARGSAVNLQPGVKYYFEFGTGTTFASAQWLHNVSGTTRSEIFPEDPNKVTIPTQSAAYVIPATGGGTASAYKVYDGWNGTSKNVVDRAGATASATDQPESRFNNGASMPDSSFAIVVKASFVIVRRVVVKGAALSNVYVYPNVTDVVIENVESSDWAWSTGILGTAPNPNAWGTWGAEESGGIHLGGDNQRITIQRNIVKDPHHGSYPWEMGSDCGTALGHPFGPMGIMVWTGGGQIVIRYNEVTGSATDKTRWLQDGISGDANNSEKGGPGPDSDIYQNIVSGVFDDAIEAEGGSRNVRVWGNYITDTKSAVAATPVHYGPMYAWRNVINRLHGCYESPSAPLLAIDIEASGFKYGAVSDNGFGKGQRYLFNNTILQEIHEGNSPLGFMMAGVEGTSNNTQSVKQTMTRNNIFEVRRTNDLSLDPKDTATGSDFQFDVYNGRIENRTSTNNLGVPIEPEDSTPAATYKFDNSGTTLQLFYKPGNGAPSVPALGGGPGAGIGNYQLGDNSKGVGVGQYLANFSEDPTRDAGAHQRGTPPMEFGIAAAHVPPTAQLSASPSSGAAALTVTLSAAGSAPGNEAIANYHFDFGDGSPGADGTQPTQTHTYTAVNMFHPAVTVTDIGGAQSTASTTVTVTGGGTGPVAHLTATPLSGTAPLTVSFSGADSTPGSAAISAYSINFGDGSSGPGVSQTHSYAGAGTFIATLTVTDANGVPSTDNKTITVTPPGGTQPSAFELFVSVNPGLIANRAAGDPFNVSVTVADGFTNVLQSVRFLVDGTLRQTVTAAPFQFSWITAPGDALGPHSLRVEATDTAGNVSIEMRPLAILAGACSGYVGATSVTQGQPLTIEVSCSSSVTVSRMEFSVDGVVRSVDTTVPHTLTLDTSPLAAGSHTVAILARLADGTTASDSTAVQVLAPALQVTLSPGPTVMWDERITFAAAATDGRTFQQVNFFVDGQFVQGVTVAPFQLVWDTGGVPAYGRHVLKVEATDTTGAQLTATRDLYLVNRACNVLLGTSKYLANNGDTVYAGRDVIAKGQLVNVRGVCSDLYSVQKLEFYLDAVGAAPSTVPLSTVTQPPYLWTLDTGTLAAGSYVVRIRGVYTAPFAGESNDTTPIDVVVP